MDEKEVRQRIEDDLERRSTQIARLADAERRARARIQEHNVHGASMSEIMRALDQPGLRSIRKSARGDTHYAVGPRPSAPGSGGVTFHFSVTSTSKGRAVLSTLSGIHPRGSAGSHQAYTERPGAAEELSGETDASRSQSYIERPDAPENNTKAISSFGNIGDTPEDRIAFWEKLEQIERQPKTHTINIDPDTSPDFWLAVHQKLDAGQPVPSAILKAHSSRQKVTVRLGTDETLSMIGFIHDTIEFTEAIRIVPGRGARIQTRIVAELPCELTPDQRLEVARAYCQPFEDEGHPYWAVIHAPDRNNDSRNFHVHINLSERPARRMLHPETGDTVWDFEITETVRDKHRNKRTRRPFMQQRSRAMNHRSWIKDERHRFCATMNAVLAAAGIEKRYDPRSYRDMGIDKVARPRVSPGAYTKERRGEPTPEGIKVARQEWKEEASRLILKQKLAVAAAIHQANIHQRYVNHMHGAQFEGARRAQLHANKWKAACERHRTAIGLYDAARYTADKLISRVRLIPPLKYTPVDKLLIKTSNVVRREEQAAFRREIEAAYNEMKVQTENLRKDLQAFKRHVIITRYRELVDRIAAAYRQQRPVTPMRPYDGSRIPLPDPPAAPVKPPHVQNPHREPDPPETPVTIAGGVDIRAPATTVAHGVLATPGKAPQSALQRTRPPPFEPEQKTPDLSADADFKMTAPEQGVSTPPPDPTGPHPEKQTDASPDAPPPTEDKEERERKRRRRRAIIAAAARNGRGL
jgi:hypothetical protein